MPGKPAVAPTGKLSDDAGKPRYQLQAGFAAEVVAGWYVTVCHEDRPHLGQCTYRRGCPAAFHRIPPNSHTDRAQPHEHFTSHARDSASILLAQLRGRMLRKNL